MDESNCNPFVNLDGVVLLRNETTTAGLRRRATSQASVGSLRRSLAATCGRAFGYGAFSSQTRHLGDCALAGRENDSHRNDTGQH